ncbi:DEAD/DEAH box helicase [Candidatus Woesearchaeota archaeon]|nr:DEAD/DEAH box helicase [Candidatus Woesearchaeota archaeon]
MVCDSSRGVGLVGLKPRVYQEVILNTAVLKNTLVVLPTGLGKTAIAVMLSAHRLRVHEHSKVVVLAPTRPLCEQHVETFRKFLSLKPEQVQLVTGFVKPEKRLELYKRSKIIIATPQCIENDIVSKRLNLEDVSLMVFDEAHRAVGSYAYVFIAKAYVQQAKHARILALTASPGSDLEKIKEVMRNLFIEALEVRDEQSEDVKPYVQKVFFEWVPVEMPAEFLKISELLKKCLNTRLQSLKNSNMGPAFKRITKKSLLDLQKQLLASASKGNYGSMQLASMVAEAIKLQYALELLQTQGVKAFHNFAKKLFEESFRGKSKAGKRIVQDPDWKQAFALADSLVRQGVDHPKFQVLKSVVLKVLSEKLDAKIIIFTQYRDTAVLIKKVLDDAGVKSSVFVGQQKKSGTGLSQKQQKAVIEDFRNNAFSCLISTSIGEEGLDIPEVDVVLFYEPIPSVIRHIQRKGRTGRHSTGRVIILYTKNTVDEAYKWTVFHKRRSMYNAIKRLAKQLKTSVKQESVKSEAFSNVREQGLKSKKFASGTVSLTEFFKKTREASSNSRESGESDKSNESKNKSKHNNDVVIVVDHRETSGSVVRELYNLGASIVLKSLSIGDYQLSDDVVVEVKTVKDFVDSLLDGRLWRQLVNLCSAGKPLLVIQGVEDLFSVRMVPKNALLGALAAIVIDYGVGVIKTSSPKETAELLFAIAKREQLLGERVARLHRAKPKTLTELQEYLVSSLPGLGLKLSKQLLKRFKTPLNVFNASVEELSKIKGLGLKKALDLKKVLETVYDAKEDN